MIVLLKECHPITG